MGHLEIYHVIMRVMFEFLNKPIHNNFEKMVSSCEISTVSASGLAPEGTMAFAGTVMTNFGSIEEGFSLISNVFPTL